MRLAVPLRVDDGIGQAEVGREVDDVLDPHAQLGHERLRRAVRESAEDEIEAVDGIDVIRLEHERRVGGGQTRIEVGDLRACLRVAGGDLDRQVRMVGTDSQQLGTGETRRADDPDLSHRMIIRRHA